MNLVVWNFEVFHLVPLPRKRTSSSRAIAYLSFAQGHLIERFRLVHPNDEPSAPCQGLLFGLGFEAKGSAVQLLLLIHLLLKPTQFSLNQLPVRIGLGFIDLEGPEEG